MRVKRYFRLVSKVFCNYINAVFVFYRGAVRILPRGVKILPGNSKIMAIAFGGPTCYSRAETKGESDFGIQGRICTIKYLNTIIYQLRRKSQQYRNKNKK